MPNTKYSGLFPSASGSGVASPVQGRLTLTSLTPIMAAAVSAAATVYFTPFLGNMAALWNGSAFVQTAFSELSQALSDTTKSPAAAVASAVYDMFLWSDGGTLRCTRGPAWTNATTRSAGTALTRVQGIPVNNAAITNGPAAGYGTYVGTIATDSSGATVSWIPGGSAAGTALARFGVWSMWNRVAVAANVFDTTGAHTPSSTQGAYNGSSADNITAVFGLSEDPLAIAFKTVVNGTAAGYNTYLFNNGSAVPNVTGVSGGGTTASLSIVSMSYTALPGLGRSTFSIQELAPGGTTPTVYDGYGMAFTATLLM